MAHAAQIDFCTKIKHKLPIYFNNKNVLDVGSLDVNGNNRYLFTNCSYIGCDVAAGANVDIISKGHELTFPDETFDTIISTECFEHDMYYEKTVSNIIRMLKSGGLFLFTCATTGRSEHGTMSHGRADCPNLEWADYYKNLTEKDFRQMPQFDSFKISNFYIGGLVHDLYFYGIKN